MKIVFFLFIISAVAFPQNHYISLEHTPWGNSNVYHEIFAISLSYQYSLLHDRVHLGPFIKYYNNVITHNVPTGSRDRGGAYGLTLKLFPLDSTILGTSIVQPCIIINVGKYDGFLTYRSPTKFVGGKVKEGLSSSFGLGLYFFLIKKLSFYASAVYEFRKVEMRYIEFIWPNPTTTTNYTIDFSSALFSYGIRLML